SAPRTPSPTEDAGIPRGRGTSNRINTSLPWYSWIFTRAPRSSGAAAIPLRIVAAHGVGSRFKRGTPVELERLCFAFLDLSPQSREHLDSGGRQVRQQLGYVAAS